MVTSLRAVTVAILMSAAIAAQQSTFTDTGGVVTLGTDLSITNTAISSPSGTMSLSCPVTALPPGTYSAEWICTGGTLTIQSYDGLTSVNATLTSGTLIETASGGGRGNPTTYYYSFSGTFAGTMAQNGQSIAVTGGTGQSLAGMKSPLGTGSIYSGQTSLNATYEPLYIADTYNNRIVRVDDMAGDNWTVFGTRGTGTNQFRYPWGIFIDGADRIYVTDSSNCRIVRMDDMSGTNWTTFGHCGSGSHQFNNPTGIFVDATGRIYVADTGNNRIVRVNDIAGDHWVTYGAAGSGTGQFNQPSGIAVDAAGKIYVADANNMRIVRMDNMAGKNWTALGSSGTGNNQFNTPEAICLDKNGLIYVVDTYNNRVLRMNDMLGTNWTVLGGTFGAGFDQFINPYGMYVDPFGTIFVSDTHDNRVVLADDMTGAAWTPFGAGGPSAGQFNLPTGIFALPPSTATPVATLSAASLTYGLTVVGTSSTSQTVTLGNIGSAPLDITSIVASSDFQQSNTCPASLPVSQNCVVTVTFGPVGAGTRPGSIAFNFVSGAKSVSLTGIGTLVAVTPTALNFGNVFAGDNRKTLTVTVSNPEVSPAGIASVTLNAGAVYSMKNQCPATLAAGASCSVKITFTPQSAKVYSGSLTVTDSSGTSQKVTITGIGAQ